MYPVSITVHHIAHPIQEILHVQPRDMIMIGVGPSMPADLKFNYKSIIMDFNVECSCKETLES